MLNQPLSVRNDATDNTLMRQRQLAESTLMRVNGDKQQSETSAHKDRCNRDTVIGTGQVYSKCDALPTLRSVRFIDS